MKTKIYSISILMIFFLIACCPSETKKQASTQDRVNELAREKYHKNYFLLYNGDSSHVAVISMLKGQKGNPGPPVKYFVYDIKSNKVLIEETLPSAEFNWIAENKLKVTFIPGTIKYGDKPDCFVFNVLWNRKMGCE